MTAARRSPMTKSPAAVRNTDSDEIKFELGSPVGASILKPASEPEGESYLCLVMPLRLAEQE